jgi:hypothetical protein
LQTFGPSIVANSAQHVFCVFQSCISTILIFVPFTVKGLRKILQKK